jgi:hypothetical protein
MNPDQEVGFELIREGEIPQARQFPRALLRDSRLTFSAKGLFVFLWDLPTGWRVRATHLANVGPQRRDAIRAILKELEAVGALRVEAVRAERGRLSGKKWVLRSPHLWAVEAPLSRREPMEPAPAKDSTEGRETRLSGSPKIGKSAAKVLTKSKVSSSSAPREIFGVFHGLATWSASDRAAAVALAAETSAEELAAAIGAVEATGKDPLPGRVRRELVRAARAKRAATRLAEAAARLAPAPLQLDPAAQAAGAAILEKIRKKQSIDQGVTP